MPPRTILLAGAPHSSAVNESTCTVGYFNESFREFISIDNRVSGGGSSPAAIAPWRSIPLHRKPLHTGFSQAHDFLRRSFNGNHEGGDFFCPSSLASSSDGAESKIEQDESILNEFCEQSLALHNSLPPSQLDDHNETTTFLEETSFISNSTTTNVTGAPRPAAPNIPPAHLSDLEDIPSAKQVTSLLPQTITVNIIAGILSIAQPRSVTTRWSQTLSLVEVLLGDDTKSGFAVTFWLSSESTVSNDLLQLRRQDVVLLQNVALHVFRGKVYGQSLRRGQTKVHLLWSKRKDANASYSSKDISTAAADSRENPQLLKTKLVQDWIIQYVGGGPGATSATNQDVWDRPPDDTQ